MANPLNTGAYRFGTQAAIDRAKDLNQIALDAEWNVPAGRIGGLVRQQRRRAMHATRRAYMLIVALCFVIFCGLVFYLGQPFFRQAVEGERLALTREIAATQDQIAKLRSDMEVQAASYGSAFLQSFDPVASPIRDRVAGHFPVPEGRMLYSLNSIFVQTDQNGTPTYAEDIDSTSRTLNHIQTGNHYLIYGDHVRIIRRDLDGSNRKDLPFDLSDLDWINLTGHAAVPDGYILYGRGENLVKIDAVGENPGAISFPASISSQMQINGHVESDYGILFYGRNEDGGVHIFRSRNGATNAQSGLVVERFTGHFVAGQKSFFYGDKGTFIGTPTPDGFDIVPANDQSFYAAGHFESDGYNWIYGQDGDLQRISAIGTQVTIDTQISGEITHHVRINDQVFLMGYNYTSDQGWVGKFALDQQEKPTIKLLHSFDTERLHGGIAVADGLLFFGRENALLHYGDRAANRFRTEHQAISDQNPSTTGTEANLKYLKQAHDLFTTFRADLPTYNRDRGNEHFGAAGSIYNQSTVHRTRLATNRARQDHFNAFPYSLVWQRELDNFEAFMTVCRAGVTPTEAGKSIPEPLTLACLEGWKAQQQTEQQGWWQNIAVQLPPGVLLLFLLSTLAGLYRYNMRMAGFHHSRADALELLSGGLDKDDIDAFDKVATALAADKVEFGKSNTPSDQAVDLAKTIASN